MERTLLRPLDCDRFFKNTSFLLFNFECDILIVTFQLWYFNRDRSFLLLSSFDAVTYFIFTASGSQLKCISKAIGTNQLLLFLLCTKCRSHLRITQSKILQLLFFRDISRESNVFHFSGSFFMLNLVLGVLSGWVFIWI